MGGEAEKFLESDFNQCFEQMRHYDSQIFSILKFQFAGYSALIGLTLGIIKFGDTKELDFRFPMTVFLIVGLAIGTFLYAMVLRNRVYFVHLARYINEIRSKFLAQKPLGVENESKMYTNCKFPQFFNFRSSQAWHLYILSALNGSLVWVVGVINKSITCAWLFFFLLFLTQLILGVIYLQSREGKSTNRSVFGKN